VLTPVSAIDLLGCARRWIAEERRGHGESAVGAIIAGESDSRLRYTVKANEKLSLWQYDAQLRLRAVG
jgi:hypothetical protein